MSASLESLPTSSSSVTLQGLRELETFMPSASLFMYNVPGVPVLPPSLDFPSDASVLGLAPLSISDTVA